MWSVLLARAFSMQTCPWPLSSMAARAAIARQKYASRAKRAEQSCCLPPCSSVWSQGGEHVAEQGRSGPELTGLFVPAWRWSWERQTKTASEALLRLDKCPPRSERLAPFHVSTASDSGPGPARPDLVGVPVCYERLPPDARHMFFSQTPVPLQYITLHCTCLYILCYTQIEVVPARPRPERAPRAKRGADSRPSAARPGRPSLLGGPPPAPSSGRLRFAQEDSGARWTAPRRCKRVAALGGAGRGVWIELNKIDPVVCLFWNLCTHGSFPIGLISNWVCF